MYYTDIDNDTLIKVYFTNFRLKLLVEVRTKMRKWMMISIILLGIFFTADETFAFDWYENIEMKVTIWANDIEYEWEYENPDMFEYEKGNTIVKGEEAKVEYEKLLSHIDLSEPKLTNEQIHELEKLDLHGIERMEIHLLDGNHRYKTWVWKNQS